MENLILASNSPRRKEILKNAGYVFDIIPSNYDEKISNLAYSDDLVINCAYNKALDVFKNNQNSIIIASDTVVVLENKILGKPKDKKNAIEMLENLSDKTHFVASSICIISKNKILKNIEKTFVTFRKLSKNEIIEYIERKNPLDKAGSYGIQDENFDFAIKIEGNLENVIGFPIVLFKQMASDFGIIARN